jgi:hypothetical protein
MLWNISRALIAAAIIFIVSDLSNRFPRLGALILTLPIVSILAFVMAWTQHGQLPAISRLARETLVLVPLGLPFFIPLAFAERMHLGFWSAFVAGIVLSSIAIGLWFLIGPKQI